MSAPCCIPDASSNPGETMTKTERELEEEIAKARKLRRLGYAVFGTLTLYLAIPMLFGAISGAMSGEIWDPYTDEHLSTQQSTARWCYEESSRLIQQAGTMNSLTRRWEEPARQWTAKCREKHPDLHQVLMQTRRSIKAGDKKER